MTLYAYDGAYGGGVNLTTVKAHGGIAINYYLVGQFQDTSCKPAKARAAGLGSILTYEQGRGELVNASRATGQAVGRTILAALQREGVPLDGSCAVYPSVDLDVSDYACCDQAYLGLRDVLAGKVSLRIYAEFGLIKHLADKNLTDGPGWLAGAQSWSDGQFNAGAVSPYVCLVQEVGSDISNTDRNTVTQPTKLGAWWPANSPYLEEDMPLSAADLNAVKAVVAGQFSRFFATVDSKGGIHDHAIAYWLNLYNAAQTAQIKAFTDPAAVAAAVIAALPTGTAGTLTQADIEAAMQKVLNGAVIQA